MADIFDIVADPTRREILGVLLDARDGLPDGEISVSQIVARLELSQPTVSKHLKVLREAKLVVVREKGQHRFYRLDTAPLEQIEDWLLGFVGGGLQPDELAGALTGQAREFAASVGKAIADTSHRVSTVTRRVTKKRRSPEE